MYVIYAEKPDVGTQIAAALDCIRLKNGKVVQFEDINANLGAIKHQRAEDGYFKIQHKGEEVIVTWGYGHLCELKEAVDYNKDYKNWRKLPVPFFPDKWELKSKEGANKQLKIVKELFKKADYIICATDDDREGELLFAYVYEYLKVKTPYKYRVSTNITTKQGWIDTFNNLIDAKQMKNVELAGRARGIADAGIGWNMTVQLTLKANTREVFNTGRCLAAVENILVKRENAIQTFVPEDYYVIEAMFTKDGINFKGELKQGRLNSKQKAEELLQKINNANGVVTEVKKTTTEKEVPTLYSLPLLQTVANSQYKYTADMVLKAVQSMYEKGYVTYPRTDICYLKEDMKGTINNVLDALEKMPTYTSLLKGRKRIIVDEENFFNDKEVTGPHYAIIPTDNTPKNLTPIEEKIYDLIAKSVIRMIYPYAKIGKTEVIIDANGVEFKASGSSIEEKGWYEVSGTPSEKFIPSMSKNNSLTGNYSIVAKKTQPPKRYTDGTLLVAMKSAGKDIPDKELRKFMATSKIEGIGKPSTQAAIIERLISLKLCTRQKDNLVPTQKGMDLINLIPFEEIKSAELTAKWEQRLNNIENGTEDYDTFIKDVKALTTDWCNKIINMQGVNIMSNSGNVEILEGVKCPVCGGDITKRSWGYGCSEYRSNNCKFSIPKELCKRKFSDAEAKKLITDQKIGPLQKFKGKYGDFEAEVELVEEDGMYKVKFVQKETDPDSKPKETSYTCLECGKPLNEFKWGYSCSGYSKGCKFAVGKEAYGKKLTEEEIEELIYNGETSDVVKDLEYDGRMFDAVLIMSEGRVKAKRSN